MQRRLALASLGAGIAAPWLARASSATLPRVAAVPGGVAVVELGAAAVRPSAMLDGRWVMVLSDGQREGFWIAIVGIALGADPTKRQTLTVRTVDGAAREIEFALESKRYAEQWLTVAPRHVDLSPQDLARYERERVHLADVSSRSQPRASRRYCGSRARLRGCARRRSACAGSLTAKSAIPTAGWTSRCPRAPRLLPLLPAQWPTPVETATPLPGHRGTRVNLSACGARATLRFSEPSTE